MRILIERSNLVFCTDDRTKLIFTQTTKVSNQTPTHTILVFVDRECGLLDLTFY